ncbi:response regulator [Lujinxingia vulgaris]|uniref:histidine kinase n=1 Tax=Lujinxingia vulgaris TaxID=2600176 RepID=A0A5C6XCE9_9DELT|nr:ATP-binding protein [Lujinxingia vulgaris]TXD39637.1 response regulator [Lujinxingia vulgaris]
MTESETLRETLLDLERARRKERELRLETEGLLRGLEILGSITDTEAMFAGLFEILQELLGFEQAFVFTGTRVEAMHLVATTCSGQKALLWRGQEVTRQALGGEPVAVFNTAMIAEWRDLQAPRSLSATSALHIGLRREPEPSLMVCTHSEPGFFSAKHVQLARRFSMLATQALLNRDLRELKLQAFERSTRDQFFNASDDAMCILDAQRRLVQTNPSMDVGLGYEAGELAGRSFESLVVEEDRAWVRAQVSELLSGHAPVGFDARFTTERGDERRLQWKMSFDREARIIYGSGRDITEQREAEDALRVLNEELRTTRDEALQASKAKSTFLATMSHELRTPLNAIMGYSEIVLEEMVAEGDTTYADDLGRIISAGKHLVSIISNVLELSKIEAERMQVHPEPFELGPLVEEVVASVGPLFKKNDNRFELRLAQDIGELVSDAAKVRQILYNLLSNAARFTRRGQVTLRVDRAVEAGSEQIIVCVQDTGVGMTPEQLEGVFEAFSQADSSWTRTVDGTGLGLAITRHLCEMLGGEIEVASESEVGSTFRVRLPREVNVVASAEDFEQALVRSASARKMSVAPEREDVEGAQGCVLVIDDDPDLHALMRRTLETAGVAMESAYNGAEGLHLAHKLAPRAIVLDVSMPVIDGWDVLRLLRSYEEFREIPVLVVTMVDNRQKALALGADDFLLKPFDRKALLEWLRRAPQDDAGGVASSSR